MIHLAVVQEMMKEVSFRDIARLRLGVILPDGAVEGNSHLKKKICENTRYTYDLEIFREQYGAYMKKDDLYLGYYLHLIQTCFIGDFCTESMAGIRVFRGMWRSCIGIMRYSMGM